MKVYTISDRHGDTLVDNESASFIAEPLAGIIGSWRAMRVSQLLSAGDSHSEARVAAALSHLGMSIAAQEV